MTNALFYPPAALISLKCPESSVGPHSYHARWQQDPFKTCLHESYGHINDALEKPGDEESRFNSQNRQVRQDDIKTKSPLLSRRSVVTRATAATLCALLPTLPEGNFPWHPPPAYSAQGPSIQGGMSCVMTKCSNTLKQCTKDLNCAKGLSCFIQCAASSSKQTAEGNCQVRCTDLYENDLLNEFTECTIAENECYPALSEDLSYPSLPGTLWDPVSYNKLEELLRGRWYIVAGLNPAFDAFDCQVHDFFAPEGIPKLEDEDEGGVIADATFSYRVWKTDRLFLTKRGDKRLRLLNSSGVIRSNSKFASGRRWGIDSFGTNRVYSIPLNTNNGKAPEKSLVLELRPNRMEYQDEWTVLASSPDTFMVVAYRGVNSAWAGYGGLNIYTRVPVTLHELRNSAHIDEIETSLRKVGLTLDDLTAVDNSCES